MSYLVVRMYVPAGEVNVEQLSERAERELAPELFKVGCLRYNTIKFDNGQIGSTMIYPDRAAAERGAQIGAAWARSSGAIEGSGPARDLRGEHVFSDHPQATGSLANTFGTIRIYRSTASIEDVQQALEQEATPLLQNAAGLLRYVVFKTDDGFVATTALTTREAAHQFTEQALEASRKSGSRLASLLPEPPEVFEGEVIQSFTPYR